MLGSAARTARADETQSGVFVSYNMEARGASVTIEQQGRPTIYVLANDAVARERETGQSWQPVALAALQPGEPVTLHFGAAGPVSEIDAEYATVAARLVILTNGYVLTTTGDRYKLIGKAANIPANLPIGTYLKLRVDAASGNAFDVATSNQPFNTAAVQGQRVTVTFIVAVPTNTPPTDIVYMATSTGNWTPNAVRMTPLTGNRWEAALTLDSGASLSYRYTRGSWTNDERNAAGVQVPNRSLSVVKTGDSQTVNDTVARWADLPS